jgi:hypothetical protein
MIEDHLLKENEIGDWVKVARICKSCWTLAWDFRTSLGTTGMPACSVPLVSRGRGRRHPGRDHKAGLSATCFSPCFRLYFLDLIFSHPHSDLMFDGDCRRKFDFSSEPMSAHWVLLYVN